MSVGFFFRLMSVGCYIVPCKDANVLLFFPHVQYYFANKYHG